jgi:MEMO1 family protein
MLRDTQGIAPTHAVLPIAFAPIVARFNGRSTCEEIARDVSRELGDQVPIDLVVKVAEELEQSLFADGAPFQRERGRIERAFAEAAVRPPSHAGGAYHGDAHKLAEYIERDCFGACGDAASTGNGGSGSNGVSGASKRRRSRASSSEGRTLVGLVAPHIDPWRGARCYGEAYGALADSLPDEVDTFVLFGTSHAPMREPFALCRKAFATPFGHMEADFEAIDTLSRACDFDPYADQLNHKREHSLEFQVVFLKHLLGDRKARIVPILAGLGEQQVNGKSPAHSKSVERFFDGVRQIVEDKRAVVVAGADLAHVGPRFGDPRPYDDAERRRLDAADRESLEHASGLDAEGFWSHVARDLDTRRVCGLAPIYALLRSVTTSARGAVRHYEQTIDPEEGSIVSHAAVGFYR